MIAHSGPRRSTSERRIDGLPFPLVEPRGGYRFRPENLLLPLLLGARPAHSILDLGAGCGVLGILAAFGPGRRAERVVLVERDPVLADTARENARCAGAAVVVVEADLRVDPSLERHDLVVMNPPFYEPGEGQPSRQESIRHATHAHHGGVREFALAAARRVRTSGRVWTLYPTDRLADLIEALRDAGLDPLGGWLLHARHTGRAYRAWVEAAPAQTGAPAPDDSGAAAQFEVPAQGRWTSVSVWPQEGR